MPANFIEIWEMKELLGFAQTAFLGHPKKRFVISPL